MASPKTPLTKTYVLLALMVILGPAGDLLLSKAMKQSAGLQAGTASAVVRFFYEAMTRGTVWLGITSLLLFMVCYLVVLSWADYSYVTPASAAGYIVVVLLGHLLLGEHVPPLRWAGVALLSMGVILVGGTHPISEKRN
jgi:drug/metabolite transporter (DMT)-like permease